MDDTTTLQITRSQTAWQPVQAATEAALKRRAVTISRSHVIQSIFSNIVPSTLPPDNPSLMNSSEPSTFISVYSRESPSNNNSSLPSLEPSKDPSKEPSSVPTSITSVIQSTFPIIGQSIYHKIIPFWCLHQKKALYHQYIPVSLQAITPQDFHH